jgi:ParB family chromosome partitioning protein
MTQNSDKKRGLARGISALMADIGPMGDPMAPAPRPDRMVAIDRIFANPDQPRRQFNPEDLAELAASIAEKGVIQPIILRERGQSGTYEIVAGERRWRASQMAQLHEIPAIIRDYSDTEVLEVAIIENIQRADLNPMDEAAGYQQLMDKFGHTQEKLAQALGKSRPYIANLLRLLHLPAEVQSYLRNGQLTPGHARPLITSGDPAGLARKVVAQGLSVRATEKLVKQFDTLDRPERKKPAPEKDADTRAIEGDLTAALGMKVSINYGAARDGGTVTIQYKTLDQLDDLCARLTGF